MTLADMNHDVNHLKKHIFSRKCLCDIIKTIGLTAIIMLNLFECWHYVKDMWPEYKSTVNLGRHILECTKSFYFNKINIEYYFIL